jgi:IS5 family transposase
MSWKQTTQNSFADSRVVEHKCLSELDDVHNSINWTEIEQTLSNLIKSLFICGVVLVDLCKGLT